jgi:hypothetical protein
MAGREPKSLTCKKSAESSEALLNSGIPVKNIFTYK